MCRDYDIDMHGVIPHPDFRCEVHRFATDCMGDDRKRIKASIEVEIDPLKSWRTTMSDPSPDTPNPSLADRIDMTRIITAGDGHRSIVFQSSVSDSDRRAAAARLRKLDRIEAALGDVWTADEIRWAVGDGRVVKMAYYPLDEMLRRLADALED
jgi:hypothetical protein